MLLDVTVIITVVCNYEVYPHNSCSVEDDQRGVSVCLSTLKPQKTTTQEAWPHSPQQPSGKSRPPISAAIGLKVQFRSVALLPYPFQWETSGGTCSSKQSQGRLSSPQPASSFPTSLALSRTCLPGFLPLLCVPLVSA